MRSKKNLKKTRTLYLILFLLVFLILAANSWANNGEIYIRLSGDHKYPGFMSITSASMEIKQLCFLGMGAKGNLDLKFLIDLSKKGIPEGNYSIAHPLPEDQWPSSKFTKSSALRFKPITTAALIKLDYLGKRGLAIHGRDFYPLIQKLISKKKMISFYNEQLFERLQSHWGGLRISNWDMGRLYDFWKTLEESEPSWLIIVKATDSQGARKHCKSPITKRKISN